MPLIKAKPTSPGRRGVVRVVSEPTLVTLSGTSATFVAGGEFAVLITEIHGQPVTLSGYGDRSWFEPVARTLRAVEPAP